MILAQRYPSEHAASVQRLPDVVQTPMTFGQRWADVVTTPRVLTGISLGKNHQAADLNFRRIRLCDDVCPPGWNIDVSNNQTNKSEFMYEQTVLVVS